MDCYVSRQIANHCNEPPAFCWYCETLISDDDKTEEVKTRDNGYQVVHAECAKELE